MNTSCLIGGAWLHITCVTVSSTRPDAGPIKMHKMEGVAYVRHAVMSQSHPSQSCRAGCTHDFAPAWQEGYEGGGLRHAHRVLHQKTVQQ